MISNEEIAPYSDLDLTTLIQHLDLADPLDADLGEHNSSSQESASSELDNTPVYNQACSRKIFNNEERRHAKDSSTNCYSNYSSTLDNSSGYSFRPQSQVHMKDYSHMPQIYNTIYPPCHFNKVNPNHPGFYLPHPGFQQSNPTKRISFPNYNNSLIFNKQQIYNGGFANSSVIINNNNYFILPHPHHPMQKFFSQGETGNRNSPQDRNSQNFRSSLRNANPTQNQFTTLNKINSPTNQPSSYSNSSSYNSEEANDDEYAEDPNRKTLEENEAAVNGYSNISEFIQNCDNPKKYLNSMKGNRDIIKLARQSSSSQQLALLEKIKSSLTSIMVSNSGNYFCQDFFSLLNQDGRKSAWSVIKEKIDFFGTQQFANHVIQKLVDLAVDLNEQKEIVGYLVPYFEILAFNTHGTHILQKVILNFEDSSKQDISSYIISNFETLAFDSCGVCLVKKYILYLKGKSNKHKTDFLRNISEYFSLMLNDIYAHYALLCIIDEWKQKDYTCVLELITNNLSKVSSQKYASRIVEKIFCVLRKVSLICNIFSLL